MKAAFDTETLIKQLISGDKKAFRHVFQIFFRDIYKYVVNRVSPEEDAEDLTQEIFIKLWNKRENLAGITNIKSYLFTIAQNHVIDHYRKKRPKEEELSESHAPVSSGDSESLKEMISEILKDLPYPHKLVYFLNRFDGLKYQEISESLGISVKTVEKRMSETLKFIKAKAVENQ